MLLDQCRSRLAENKTKGLTRVKTPVFSRDNTSVAFDAQHSFVNFSNNDYLGLSIDPEVKKSFVEGIDKYGLGSGSAPHLSGFYDAHYALEKAFAGFLGYEDALLFNSGYHANLGVITTLGSKEISIYYDKLSHASIIDAILLSRAERFRYAHNDKVHLMTRMEIDPREKLLITEGVFSMEGDVVSREIIDVALEQKATIVIDDAHGIGVLGKQGKGIVEHYKLSPEQVPLLVLPFGKAIGSFGAVVVGDAVMIEMLRQFARSHMYSTAFPPAIAHATMKSLKLLSQDTWRREQLHARIRFFIDYAKSLNLPLISDDLTPIKSILIGGNDSVLRLQAHLKSKGFLASAIRTPTVPPNTARIRFSLNCFHTEAQIKECLDACV